LINPAQWVFDEYGPSVTKQVLSCELRTLGSRKLSAQPRHHQILVVTKGRNRK